MLSFQQHYDWGLRSLKTILKGCSDVISQKRIETQNKRLTSDDEAQIILQTLQLNTFPKLTFNDALLFNQIIDDIFPGTDKSIKHVFVFF